MNKKPNLSADSSPGVPIASAHFIGLLMELEQRAYELIRSGRESAEELRLALVGPKSDLAQLIKRIRQVPISDRQHVGETLNQVKQSILAALEKEAGAEVVAAA